MSFAPIDRLKLRAALQPTHHQRNGLKRRLSLNLADFIRTKPGTFFTPETDSLLFSLFCCLEAGRRKAENPSLPLDPNKGRNKKGALELQKNIPRFFNRYPNFNCDRDFFRPRILP